MPRSAAQKAKAGASRTTTTDPYDADPLPGMPPVLDPSDIYSADAPGNFTSITRGARPLVYVPDTLSDDLEEIDPSTYQVVARYPVGSLPQHVVPSYNGSVLWVLNDGSNTLTPINPQNGVPGQPIPVTDPYNLYFTPDGRYAIVVAERLQELNFLNAQTMTLVHTLPVPTCAGVNHIDFTANGRYLLASCEFQGDNGGPGTLIVVNVATQSVVQTIHLSDGASPQDVKLSPDGSTFYVADLNKGGVWLVSARNYSVEGFVSTGAGAHGLYTSRNEKDLYVSDRSSGQVSVISFATRQLVATWTIPGGSSPDMGNVSADGKVLWLSGRYNNVAYALSTSTGQLLARIPVGYGPHGICVWPQPGRYSLGHTGIMR
jgi:DNA-binding beta-propeller fold protein YncE